MARIVVQNLAVYSNENVPNSIKYVQNIAKVAKFCQKMVTLDRSECNFASQIRHLEIAQLAKTQIRIDFPSKIICHKNQMKHIESDRVSPPPIEL